MPATLRHRFTQLALAMSGLLSCVAIALLLHLAIGAGRDLRVTGAGAAMLLVAMAGYLSGWRGYAMSVMIAALLIVELMLIAAIGWFAYGGVPRLDRFFLSWFGGGTALLAVPWMLGVAMGSRWRSVARHPERSDTCH